MLRGLFVRVFVLVALPVCFVRPFAGLCLYLWYSHFRLNDFVWKDYSFDNGALLLACTTLLGYFVFEVWHSPLRVRGLILLVLFWIWIALATLFATDKTLAYPKLSQYSHIFIITFLIAAMANSERRVRTLLHVIAFALGTLGAKSCFDFLITGGQYRMRGPGGLMTEENEYALAMTMAVPILFLLARVQNRRLTRRGLQILGAACAITVVGTRSRAGVLGLGVALLLLTLYSKRKVLGVVTLFMSLALLPILAPTDTLKRYESIPTAAATDYSAIGRLQAWRTALAMTRDHPLFGVGPLNFLTSFPHYSPYHVREAHNAFLALMAESGIPSCLLFVAMIYAAIFEMWRLRRRLHQYTQNEQLQTFCLIIQVTLTVYLVPVIFLNRQNQDLMYHLLGISVGLAGVSRHVLQQHRLIRSEQKMSSAAGVYEPVIA